MNKRALFSIGVNVLILGAISLGLVLFICSKSRVAWDSRDILAIGGMASIVFFTIGGIWSGIVWNLKLLVVVICISLSVGVVLKVTLRSLRIHQRMELSK